MAVETVQKYYLRKVQVRSGILGIITFKVNVYQALFVTENHPDDVTLPPDQVFSGKIIPDSVNSHPHINFSSYEEMAAAKEVFDTGNVIIRYNDSSLAVDSIQGEHPLTAGGADTAGLATEATLASIDGKLDTLAKEETLNAVNTKVDDLATETTLAGASAKLDGLSQEATLAAASAKLDDLSKETTLAAASAKLDDLAQEATLAQANTELQTIASSIHLAETEM